MTCTTKHYPSQKHYLTIGHRSVYSTFFRHIGNPKSGSDPDQHPRKWPRNLNNAECISLPKVKFWMNHACLPHNLRVDKIILTVKKQNKFILQQRSLIKKNIIFSLLFTFPGPHTPCGSGRFPIMRILIGITTTIHKYITECPIILRSVRDRI